MSEKGFTIIERNEAHQACRSLACVFSETRSETIREACKSAINALCQEYQIVQFGLLAYETACNPREPSDNGLSVSIWANDCAAISVVREWADEMEACRDIGMPAVVTPTLSSALSSLAKAK